MLNKVVLIGRLTADPEMRYTGNGTPVAGFTVAVDRAFSKEKETDFIPVVVWQKLAENCANHLGKGRLVAVDGRIQVRSYQDKDGNKRKATEVVANDVRFLDFPKDGQQKDKSSLTGSADNITFDESEIPFS